MINVSNEYKQYIKEDREFICKATITLKSGLVLNITDQNIMSGGFKFEEGTSGNGTFDIGAAVIGKFTLILDNTDGNYNKYDFTDAVIRPTIGLRLSRTVETLNKGVYTVDEAKYLSATVQITALDNLCKFEKDYVNSTLRYPATLSQIVRGACSDCGVTLNTTTFDNRTFEVTNRPDDAMSYLDVISYAAQIAGCYAKCNNNGQLVLKWYDFDSGSYHDINTISSQDICLDDVVITGIQVEEAENKEVYEYGKDGYKLSVQGNPFIVGPQAEDVAKFLGDKMIGTRFRPLSVSAHSDPSREAGDMAQITDRQGNKHKVPITNISFSAGAWQPITADAETPSRNSADMYSAVTKAIKDSLNKTEKEKSDRELAIEELNNLLENSSGLYYTGEPQEDGSMIHYLHDKKTLEESMIVWKMTAEAWGVSTDGGKTYPYGMTVDGLFIANILDAIGIRAEWIEAGSITVDKLDVNYVQSVENSIGAVQSSLETTIANTADFILLEAKEYTLERTRMDYCINGSFTDGLNDWTISDASRVTAYTDGSVRTARLRPTSNSNATIRQTVEGLKVDEYMIQFKAKAASGSQNAVIRCTFNNSSKYTTAGQINTSGYTVFTFYYNVTMAGNKDLILTGYTPNTTVYITDIRILGHVGMYATSRFELMSDRITSEVTRATVAETILQSTITQTAESLTSTITNVRTNLQSQITQNATSITLKVSKGNVSSEISAESNQVTISSNRLVINSDNCTLTRTGRLTVTGATINGTFNCANGNYFLNIRNASIVGGYNNTTYGQIDLYEGYTGNNNHCLRIRGYNHINLMGKIYTSTTPNASIVQETGSGTLSCLTGITFNGDGSVTQHFIDVAFRNGLMTSAL